MGHNVPKIHGGRLMIPPVDQVEVSGYIELRTTFTDEAGSRTEKIKYLIVNAPSAYNILLGAIPSTRHMKVKLPSMEGVVITIKSDQKEAKRCYENSLKNKRSVSYVTTTPPPGVKPRSTVTEEAAGRDVVMVDAELGEGNTGLEEEEARNRPEEAREQGIARAVIARESRPKPVEQWFVKEIGRASCRERV